MRLSAWRRTTIGLRDAAKGNKKEKADETKRKRNKSPGGGEARAADGGRDNEWRNKEGDNVVKAERKKGWRKASKPNIRWRLNLTVVELS